MPTYEYHCSKCGHVFEQSHSITAEPLKKCPKCEDETLKRGPGGGIGISFKGSGFYITDYPKDGGASKGKEDLPQEPSSESSGGGCGCGDSSCTK